MVSRSKSWSSIFILRADVEVLRSFVRRDGEFVAILPLTLPATEFGTSVNMWGSYGQGSNVLFFWTDGVYAGWAKKVGGTDL